MSLNRRKFISYIGLGIGGLSLTGCENDLTKKTDSLPFKVNNIDELRHLKTKYSDGQLIIVSGHTKDRIGGGTFIVDSSLQNAQDDNGSLIVGLHKNIFRRVNVEQPMAEMFGARVDEEEDQSVFINKCTQIFKKCYLQGGTTYNIQHPITAIALTTVGADYATLNLVSPYSDNRFGESPYGDSAGVYCNGEIGAPLYGVNIENIIVLCNGLINSNGNVGVKGFLFMRCHGFYQRNCFVYESSSYAFWDADADKHILYIQTYCSGTRENCFAIDSHISFEQVNCRGIILSNCHAYRSKKQLPYTVEALFHCYGGTDMQLVYKNCSGIAEGQCTAVMLFARECKNVLINDCQFINNFDNGSDIQAGVFFEGQRADYDEIQFLNSTLISKFSHSVVLTTGEFGSSSATFNLIDCIIEGAPVGVQINGSGGVFKFKNCSVQANASGEVVPWAYYSNGNPSTVEVIGGNASAIGDIVVAVSNMNASVFQGVALSPTLV